MQNLPGTHFIYHIMYMYEIPHKCAHGCSVTLYMYYVCTVTKSSIFTCYVDSSQTAVNGNGPEEGYNDK